MLNQLKVEFLIFRFSSNIKIEFFLENKQSIFNIMMTYIVYHPNPEYSQGMTDMLTPIVYVFENESLSYFAYCSLMTRYMNSIFDHDQIEMNHRFNLFNFLFQSIDYQLWKTIDLLSNSESYLFVYRWLLLDCKREFYSFDQILRILELIWIYSLNFDFKSKICHRSLFTICLCISILEEDREKILSFSNEEDLHRYFFSSKSSSSRSKNLSRQSIERILQRAKFYYSNYFILNK